MREIKFRGKRLDNGNWVYGDLRQENSGRKVIMTNLNTWGDNADDIEPYGEDVYVNTESVGQFTGLHDNKGNEIYEGDILQLDYITTIGKHRIGISCEVKWCSQEGRWVGFDGFVENALQQTHKMFVVKGNIHDNPELMEGGEK